jgi:hypothetical protein
MNHRGLWTVAVLASLALAGCGDHDHTPPAASTPPPSMPPPTSNSPPSDLVSFVNAQLLLQPQPDLSVAPASTSSLTTNLGLGDATAFSSVKFGQGDALAAGTDQAAVECAAIGSPACTPTVSADLNSTLN